MRATINGFFKEAFSIMLFLTRFCDWINNQVARLTASVLFLMLIFSACAIFFRYVMGNAINWAEDVILPAFVWVALLGTTVAFRVKGHIRVDSFVNLFSDYVQKQVNRLIYVTIIAFSAYLTIQGCKVVLATRSMPWGILQLPPTYFYVAFPISFFLIFLYGIDDFLKTFRELDINSKHSS